MIRQALFRHCFSLLSFAFNYFPLFTLEVLLDKFSFFYVSNNSLLTVFCCFVLILYFGDSVPYVIKTSITWICLLGFFFSFLCAEGRNLVPLARQGKICYIIFLSHQPASHQPNKGRYIRKFSPISPPSLDFLINLLLSG